MMIEVIIPSIIGGIAIIIGAFINVKFNNAINQLKTNNNQLNISNNDLKILYKEINQKLDICLADNKAHIERLEECQRELAKKALNIAMA